MMASTLLLAQDKFVRNLAVWRLRVAERHPDWIVTGADVCVSQTRAGRSVVDRLGTKQKFVDMVHMPTSHHYDRLAGDFNVFVPTTPGDLSDYRAVVDSMDPVWLELHQVWLEIDPLNRIMPASSGDANHLSRAVDEQDKRI